MTTSFQVSASFRGTNHPLTISPDDTLGQLCAQLEDLTNVPVSVQKLFCKGKKLPTDGEEGLSTLVSALGIKSNSKLQLLGSTMRDLEGLKATERDQEKREQIMRARQMAKPVKVRGTGSAPTSPYAFRFHDIKPLSHLPNPASALAILKKLSDDPAIQHVMQEHRFTVGLLTELAPHEHPGLLGLNENAGQAIKLRIRTDRYDGFRLYKEIRRVLLHELTHNVHGDHDEKFKALNSRLNKEVLEYERNLASSTHTLSGLGDGDIYQPSSDLDEEQHSFVLGGSQTVSSPSFESAEDRRRKILEAAMKRLEAEEKEIEDSCGTGNPTEPSSSSATS